MTVRLLNWVTHSGKSRILFLFRSGAVNSRQRKCTWSHMFSFYFYHFQSQLHQKRLRDGAGNAKRCIHRAASQLWSKPSSRRLHQQIYVHRKDNREQENEEKIIEMNGEAHLWRRSIDYNSMHQPCARAPSFRCRTLKKAQKQLNITNIYWELFVLRDDDAIDCLLDRDIEL